ncbi:MAG: DNA polymerase III subunit delta' [Erythrobacter sp.]
MDWPNHNGPQREWREALRGERMHHGWLLAGKAGLGKSDFAKAAARELVAEEGIAQPAGDHPDIVLLTYLPKDEKEEKKRDEGKPFQTKRNISVSQIRAMQRRLTTRPTLGSRRAIIIEPADDMEKGASNALLKSLEEPPQGTFFLLVTHRPARLLPTIRSRCRILRFPLLDAEQLGAMLDQNGAANDPASREAAMQAANGSFGAALGFVEQDLGPIAKLISGLLIQGDPRFAARGELARLIGPRADRVRLQAVMELAQNLVADAAQQAADPDHRTRCIEAHGELVTLAAQAPTYNFDTGLLSFEIGSLLVRASGSSEPAHG